MSGARSQRHASKGVPAATRRERFHLGRCKCQGGLAGGFQALPVPHRPSVTAKSSGSVGPMSRNLEFMSGSVGGVDGLRTLCGSEACSFFGQHAPPKGGETQSGHPCR
jgi:hypothetical protein